MCLHRQSVSVPASLVCYHRLAVFVTDSLCLSQNFLYVSAYLHQTLFLIILGLIFTYLYVIFMKIICIRFVFFVANQPPMHSRGISRGRVYCCVCWR